MSTIAKRADAIPLRLTPTERSVLRVLDGALMVSEYTDAVDVLSSWRSSRASRIQAQVTDTLAAISGMIVAALHKTGKELVLSRSPDEKGWFYAKCFEIGRRYKMMNPDKMRSTYGKLMYMLQDAAQPEMRTSLGFSVVNPVVTVASELKKLECADLLDDPQTTTAVRPLRADESAEAKAQAVAALVERYARGDAAKGERIALILHSIGDDIALTEAPPPLSAPRTRPSHGARLTRHLHRAGARGADRAHARSTALALLEDGHGRCGRVARHLGRAQWRASLSLACDAVRLRRAVAAALAGAQSSARMARRTVSRRAISA